MNVWRSPTPTAVIRLDLMDLPLLVDFTDPFRVLSLSLVLGACPLPADFSNVHRVFSLSSIAGSCPLLVDFSDLDWVFSFFSVVGTCPLPVDATDSLWIPPSSGEDVDSAESDAASTTAHLSASYNAASGKQIHAHQQPMKRVDIPPKMAQSGRPLEKTELRITIHAGPK
mmetsp:Transcript_67908/g.189643  ORF Transcript_67908/g.189643 Transcript_67908/m.189643 type:complete len:170 (+) Transcript_67908:1107-1616(+)